MAKFCTKCGSPLAEDVQFCINCGATVATAPATSPAAPGPAASAASLPPVAAPAAGPSMAAAPAAKSGSPVMKIILIVVGVLILLTALGIGSCVYVAYRIKQRSSAIMHGINSGRTSFGTPEVRIEKGGAGSEAEEVATMDVPPYPGATATEGGGSLGAAGFGIAAQEYVTSDSVDQVIAFYKEKLGNKLSLHESGGNAVLQVKTGANSLTTISLSRDEAAGHTKINIMRIGK
jgi:hypothetical protein